MRTPIQNANHLFLPLSHLLLMAGLMISLGSCTDVADSPTPVFPVELDPVTKYSGSYKLQENLCASTNQPLEIRPYIPGGGSNVPDYQQAAKMISIYNLGMMTMVDVTATWNGHVFMIERQKVILNDNQLSTISGQLCFHGENNLSVSYEVNSPKVNHGCIAEYVKNCF